MLYNFKAQFSYLAIEQLLKERKILTRKLWRIFCNLLNSTKFSSSKFCIYNTCLTQLDNTKVYFWFQLEYLYLYLTKFQNTCTLRTQMYLAPCLELTHTNSYAYTHTHTHTHTHTQIHYNLPQSLLIMIFNFW